MDAFLMAAGCILAVIGVGACICGSASANSKSNDVFAWAGIAATCVGLIALICCFFPGSCMFERIAVVVFLVFAALAFLLAGSSRGCYR